MSALDFVVWNTPASLQSSGRHRERWREQVRAAARRAISEEEEVYGECRGIVVFFYFGATRVDVDNIIKPVADALCAIAFPDDRLVGEWISRKTDLEQTILRDPPPCVAAVLADSLAARQPFVYICIVGEGPNHADLPK